MATPKASPVLRPTDADVGEFMATVNTSEVRRADAAVLLEIMREETGQEARMWGPSIIGFGQYHYKYASGHEGDAPVAGFSPRKAHLVVYGLTYPSGVEHLMARLGKFKASVSCVYINKLADIDEAVLRELIRRSYRYTTTEQSHED